MIEKDRQDMSNPIGLCLCKLMLCSVFALLPYPHKAGRFRFLSQQKANIICKLILNSSHKRLSVDGFLADIIDM